MTVDRTSDPPLFFRSAASFGYIFARPDPVYLKSIARSNLLRGLDRAADPMGGSASVAWDL